MQRVWSTYLDSSGVQRERSSSPGPHLMDSPRSSRPASIANSAYSNAGSTKHILAGMHSIGSSNDFDYGQANLLHAPLASSSTTALTSPGPTPLLGPGGSPGAGSSSVSLTVNYLPSKFSNTLLSPSGTRKRKGGKGSMDPVVPKRGGGVDAFRSGEARMPGHGVKKLRWTKFKWILFSTNFVFSMYAITSLIFCLITWFNVWTHADVVRVGNRPELIISTVAAGFGIITSIIGWAGILLNNRSFLAWYTFLLWLVFALLLTPGYMSYKRRTFNLEGKVNAQWSRSLGADGRLRIQNALQCCGYFSPFVEATISQTCYARSVLDGCKLPYIEFERLVLARWYTVAFSLVPVHLAVMLAGLLCSNHVTYTFGKGMMPEAYRLNMNSMAVIMDNYATQLAEQYGSDVASEIIKRSRSNLHLDTMSSMPYQSQGPSPGGHIPATQSHAKYESVGGRAPEAF